MEGWNLPCNKPQKLSSNSLIELRRTEFPFQAAGAERKQGPSEGAVPGTEWGLHSVAAIKGTNLSVWSDLALMLSDLSVLQLYQRPSQSPCPQQNRWHLLLHPNTVVQYRKDWCFSLNLPLTWQVWFGNNSQTPRLLIFLCMKIIWLEKVPTDLFQVQRLVIPQMQGSFSVQWRPFIRIFF